jgi:putative pyruvate formate lyase activating enzyme
MVIVKPAYLSAFAEGHLQKMAKKAAARLSNCTLCPRDCRVNRLSGETGLCSTADNALVSSFCPHFGEERPLVGTNGSGTIFFTHCNLLCNFCQNFDISHQGNGQLVDDQQLAQIMLSLQHQGCHNINLVTPSHVVPHILRALVIAVDKGLSIPLVYNSSGYDRVETLKQLDGIVDIYMPDFKFWDADVAQETCRANDYPRVARKAVMEMFRQVGDLEINDQGIATRGLLIRHLVLPHGLAGTNDVMRFIAHHISVNTYVNIMPQYRPCGTVHSSPRMSRMVTPEEFDEALTMAQQQGLDRLDPLRRTFVMR